MKPFSCTRCDQTVFFENTHCGACQAHLAFVPELRRMVSFEVDGQTGVWQSIGLAQALRRHPCVNLVQHDVCNWTVPETAGPQALCSSCQLTRVVPNLAEPQNLRRWALIERAKRRLVFTLMDLGLTPEPKTADEDVLGLSFHFVASEPDQPAALTGHDQGVITLNIAEADDAHRELTRVAFNEQQRTLLGHLRHEVSHYLQYRWLDRTPAQDSCRAVFGDERADYNQALQQYHANGPEAGWEQSFISAYASAHPWEDWAETCAHFLLMVDAVQTASAWGLRLDGPTAAEPAYTEAGELPRSADLVLHHWLPVAQFLNAMSRSIGVPDSYPFTLPNAVLHKLDTVQTLLSQAATPAPAGEPVASAASTPPQPHPPPGAPPADAAAAPAAPATAQPLLVTSA